MSSTTVEEHEYMTRVSYASTVSSLIYAMVCTRPDLSQAVSMINRYMHDLARDMRGSKVVLQYIKGTISVGLVFKKDSTGKQKSIGYVDYDYARDLDKRRSIMRYVFTLSQASVSWRSIL